MEQWQIDKFYQQITLLLKTKHDELSEQERKVLADALLLIKREEPIVEILAELYQRLGYIKDASKSGIEPALIPELEQLYQSLAKYNDPNKMILAPGLEGVRVLWPWVTNDYQLKKDEQALFTGFVGTALDFDPSEYTKSISTAFAKVDDPEVMEDAKTLGHALKFWALIFFGLIAALFFLWVLLVIFKQI